MLLAWLRDRRRRRLLDTPFPPEWDEYLRRNVAMYARLPAVDRAALCDITRVLVAEKNWEGCGGLAMNDEVRVTVAAQAARLLLGLRHDYYARVGSILVYPRGFRSPDGWRTEAGVVDVEVGAAGEAWYDGPVVLAWDAVLAGGRDPDDGRNVVLHEFAHQLDYLDGMVDGTPPLSRKEDYARWQQVMSFEFARLTAECAGGTPKVLDRYGATSPAEFFAVATEAFFEKPVAMRERHPDLYAVLKGYYAQDPAGGGAGGTVVVGTVETGRKPRRTSRTAAKTEAYAAATADWPGWVTFWEIHPGVSRTQALRPHEHQTSALVGAVLAFSLFVGVSYLDGWRVNAGEVVTALLALVMVGLWVWLWRAVRWVDRHAAWGGDVPSATAGRSAAGNPPATDPPAPA